MTCSRAAMLSCCLSIAGCLVTGEDDPIAVRASALDDEPCWPDCHEPCYPHCNSGSGPPTTVSGVTLSGRATFDDRRDYGRFALRSSASGATGAHHAADGNASNRNDLGLYDATVVIYEVDRNYDSSETDCYPLSQVGSANVGPAGNWSLTLASITDSCGSDGEGSGVRLAVETALKHIGDERRFKMLDPATFTENEDMDIWSLWLPSATSTSPFSVSSNVSVTFGTQRFEDASGETRSNAAMIFASLVDITRKFHVQNDWPFFNDEYGPVYVRFPSVESARTLGPRTIEIGSGEFGYGWTPMHEYGHVLHERVTPDASSAWSSSARMPCGNNFAQPTTSPSYVLDTAAECDSWSRDGELEHDAKAWKEGFADFAAHVTLENVTSPYPVGCSAPQYDVNDSADGPVTSDKNDRIARRRIFGCGTSTFCTIYGADYPTNVARALCDWFDDTADDDPQRTGAGDGITHSLFQMYQTMSGAYDSMTQTELSNDGFTMCDFAAHHIVVEGNHAATHREALANNGFTCSL